MNSDFYIGYLNHAPEGIARFIKRFLVVVAMGIILLAWLLASQQQEFSTSTYQYAEETELTGRLITDPFPAIQILQGLVAHRHPIVQTIPLVKFGKLGGASLISYWREKSGQDLSQVTVKGHLIFYDGKALLDISDPDKGLVSIHPEKEDYCISAIKLDQTEFIGEIVDAKCFFGVMKPGHGKPHRSCAIRCISGGIPAVLRVRSTFDQTAYHFISMESGPISSLAGRIGETVEINGELLEFCDWTILRIKDASSVTPLTDNFTDGFQGVLTLCN